MRTPTISPEHRKPNEIAPVGNLPLGALVWVYRCGEWRPGVVLAASDRAAMVRYRPTHGSGTGVETAVAADLADRTEHDPLLDPHEPGCPHYETALPTRLVER